MDSKVTDDFLSYAGLKFKPDPLTFVSISADGWYALPGSGPISPGWAKKYNEEVRVLKMEEKKNRKSLLDAEIKMYEANAKYDRKMTRIKNGVLALLLSFLVFGMFAYGCAHNNGVAVLYEGEYVHPVVEKRVNMVQYWEFDERYNLNLGYYYEFKGMRGAWKWYDTGVMVWEY